MVHEVTALRPSFLKQFDAVIDAGRDTPEAFLRDLLIRNVPVVALNREPGTYSVHTIGTDRALGAAALARDLALAGHHAFAVVRWLPRSIVPATFEQAALRYCPEATVKVIAPEDVLAAVEGSKGVTAVVCDSVDCARMVRSAIEEAKVRLPDELSLAAVGCCDENHPCSGQFVDSRVAVAELAELLKAGGCGPRPATLWLAPRWVDKGTTGPLPRHLGEEAA
jgi:DNA-binding LacI/PurR family transcriptional regulator